MDNSHIKEELSISYINTVASIAGIDYEIVRHDDDSTDAILKKWIFLDEKMKFLSSLRIQLKTTSSKSKYNDNGKIITYSLKAKNYNDLCMPATIPIILGLLILPEEEADWVEWTPQELYIKGCMYWVNLANESLTSNKDEKTVKIEKENVINSETLQYMLEKIAKEGQV